jgi:hypothetical protein
MGRAASLNRSLPRLIAQIAKPNAHVMMHGIRNRNSHAEAEDGMRQSKRIQVAIAKKEGAGNQSPYQCKANQYRVWNMRNRKQQRRCRNSQ